MVRICHSIVASEIKETKNRSNFRKMKKIHNLAISMIRWVLIDFTKINNKTKNKQSYNKSFKILRTRLN